MPRPLIPHSGVHPYVRLIEQPASKALRFRYECEGRSAGSIPGVNSTQERKTYPTIEITGHRGPAIVVVSLVTKDEPFKPHPHNLVGRERCDKGVCTMKTTITDENQQVSFSNLGIQCVKRKDITDALRTREELRVDPFKTGFSHRNQPQSIDLNAVRLCFQVFIHDEESKKIRHALQPVVSEIIYDKKAISELSITRLSQCSACLKGGTEIILLCDRVTREDISVIIFEKKEHKVVWETSANILLVHRQFAIAFNTPPYHDQNAGGNIKVYLQLRRPSDNARSEPVPFEYTPDYQDSSYLKHKRTKTLSSYMSEYDQEMVYHESKVKREKPEPRDKSSPHHHLGNSPLHVFPPSYNEPDQIHSPYHQQWHHQQQHTGISHINYGQDLDWVTNYPIPNMQQPLSPNHQQVTSMQNMVPPNVQPYSPNAQVLSPNPPMLSPNPQVVSPNPQVMSPNGQVLSPNAQVMSPNGQVLSPHMHMVSTMTHGGMSPNMGHVSPGMDHISPGLGHVSPNLGQCMPQQQQQLLEPLISLSGMLRGSPGPGLASSDLASLNAFLERSPDLSDSLNRLSTNDLLRVDQ